MSNVSVGSISPVPTEEEAAAIAAAETGHLVFGTLHTTGAAKTIDRIVNAFPTNQQEQIRIQLSTVLQAVISQLLIPRVDKPGRVAAFEIMINTPIVRKMIEENRLDKLSAAIETGTEDGMISFNQSLFNLVKAGKVTEKEALSKASNPQALEMNFRGIFLDEGRRILS